VVSPVSLPGVCLAAISEQAGRRAPTVGVTSASGRGHGQAGQGPAGGPTLSAPPEAAHAQQAPGHAGQAPAFGQQQEQQQAGAPHGEDADELDQLLDEYESEARRAAASSVAAQQAQRAERGGSTSMAGRLCEGLAAPLPSDNKSVPA
jgi:hypothetical protein